MARKHCIKGRGRISFQRRYYVLNLSHRHCYHCITLCLLYDSCIFAFILGIKKQHFTHKDERFFFGFLLVIIWLSRPWSRYIDRKLFTKAYVPDRISQKGDKKKEEMKKEWWSFNFTHLRYNFYGPSSYLATSFGQKGHTYANHRRIKLCLCALKYCKSFHSLCHPVFQTFYKYIFRYV